MPASLAVRHNKRKHVAKKKTKKRASTTRRRKQKPAKGNKLRRIVLAITICAIVAAVYYWPQLSSILPTQQQQTVGRAIANSTELQIALARTGYSPGSIDGASGSQTKQALLAYQTANDLPLTGEFDTSTSEHLKIEEPVFIQRKLSQQDFNNVAPAPTSWRERGRLDKMRYNSLLEMVAEQAQTDPDLIKSLNSELNWSHLSASDTLTVPNVPPYRVIPTAAYVQISLSKRTLQVFDAEHQLHFHCPVSIARRVDKRPSGELRVKVRVENPNYTFNPAILTGTAQREGITQKFIIQPGPNNPVGAVWIGLNLPSYGIHGTPEPEKVGRTESSGCFRLANWNAQTLVAAVRVDMPIYVQP